MSDNKGNGRAVFEIHALTTPGGKVPGDLVGVLGKALDSHQGRHGQDPAGIVVNGALISDVVEAVKVMGLNGLQVTSSGGCLLWEMWMEISTDGHEPSKGKRRPVLMDAGQSGLFEETPQL